MFAEWLKALLYGILEGVTEWLPVSSTGHLILFADLLPFGFSGDQTFLCAFWEFFEVAVQFGAVLAVPTLFWRTLVPRRGEENKKETFSLWGKIFLASLPVAVVGVVGDRLLEKWTGRDLQGWFYRPLPVALTLIGYGIVFLFVDRIAGRRARTFLTVDITAGQATSIGAFQVLSLIPGTSRSGATLLGGVLSGVAMEPAASFSFFLAIPVMMGALLVKGRGFLAYLSAEGNSLSPAAWSLLLVGCLSAYLTSLVALRFLVGFVKRRGLAPFGVYRILLGTLVLLLTFRRGGT